TVEAGVIARTVLGNPNANAWVGGCAITTEFVKSRPEVAKRFTAGWGQAVSDFNGALVWAAMTYTKPWANCGGETGYWADPPTD
ncbi:MAG: hypothetical protein J0I02_07325, partial [Alphaproteobacteria bacterium]|nr:hypothetical protein [Alphaproteobacteria bacterium]